MLNYFRVMCVSQIPNATLLLPYWLLVYVAQIPDFLHTEGLIPNATLFLPYWFLYIKKYDFHLMYYLAAVFLTAVATIAAFIGQHAVRKLIMILGRASLIIFILAFTIFVSAISLGQHPTLPIGEIHLILCRFNRIIVIKYSTSPTFFFTILAMARKLRVQVKDTINRKNKSIYVRSIFFP